MTDDRTELSRPLTNDLLLASERILADLIAAQRDRVRRRRSRRAQTSAALLFLVALLAVRYVPATSRSTLPPTPSPPLIEIVQSAPRPITVEYLTDDDVVAELRAAGINAGLVRTAERVMIVGR